MIFYHGTAALHLAAIKAKGLIPKAAPGGDVWAVRSGSAMVQDLLDTPARRHSVYLTRKLIVAQWFADMAAKVNADKPLVLRVSLTGMAIKNLHHDEEGSIDDPDFAVRYEGTIPPEVISVLPAAKMPPQLLPV